MMKHHLRSGSYTTSTINQASFMHDINMYQLYAIVFVANPLSLAITSWGTPTCSTKSLPATSLSSLCLRADLKKNSVSHDQNMPTSGSFVPTTVDTHLVICGMTKAPQLYHVGDITMTSHVFFAKKP